MNIIVLNNQENSRTQYGFVAGRNINNVIRGSPTETGQFQNMGNNCLYLSQQAVDINNYYKNMVIVVTSGLAVNDIRIIKEYNGKDKSILVENDFSETIKRGDTYSIYSEVYVGLFYDELKNEFQTTCINNIDINDSKKTKVNIHSMNGIFDSSVSARSYFTTSDVKLKKNIIDLGYTEANEIVQNVNSVKFKWNDELNADIDNKEQLGFIAQDIEKIITMIVKTDEDGYKSVEYNKIIPVLVEVIKGLTNRVSDLENRINGDMQLS